MWIQKASERVGPFGSMCAFIPAGYAQGPAGKNFKFPKSVAGKIRFSLEAMRNFRDGS